MPAAPRPAIDEVNRGVYGTLFPPRQGLPVPQFYFEDFAPGSVAQYGPRVVTREEIVAFAAEFDPQPMHLDEAAARASMLGGLSASGWHTCAILMRMCCDWFILDSASMGAPGVDEVKWLRPVRPGDALTLRRTVRDTRVSASRPEMGFVRFLYELINQRGEVAMTLTTPAMLSRRAPAAAAS
jgi:acyl dehydratase